MFLPNSRSKELLATTFTIPGCILKILRSQGSKSCS
jgi:hypothetical protein